MANTITNPAWVKAKPHGSAEKQVGDSDPQSRTDVINRPAKGAWFRVRQMLDTLMDGITFDGTDVSSTGALTGAAGGGLVLPLYLTNKTGVSLAAGDVAALDSANDKAVALGDTSAGLFRYVVALATIANNAVGRFALAGIVTVNTTGTIARLQYIKKSVTTKVVDDAGTAMSASNSPPAGAIGVALTAAAAGQCTALMFGMTYAAGTSPAPLAGQLQYVSGTSIKFVPYNGARIRIAGTDYDIPSGGVASGNPTTTSNYVNGTASQTLSASTVYLVTVFNNGGTLTLDFLTTLTHAQDTTAGNVGVEIKSGDNTRTVVGMIRTNATPNFVDSDAQRFTISWFNRRPRALLNAFAADRSTTSATYAEISSSERIEFLLWSGEHVVLYVSGSGENSVSGSSNKTSIGLDGTTASDGFVVSRGFGAGAGNETQTNVSLALSGLAEGYHYATILGKTTGTTMIWYGSGTAGLRTTIGGVIHA